MNTFNALDGSWEAQCDRINRLVSSGCVTPALGSLMLSYYAMGREEAGDRGCDAGSYAKANFNTNHDIDMQNYRTARPAKLVTY